ncbi:MAG: alpha-2-macroglobulin family protein, partial [Flavobacteriales bacterium]
ESGNRVLETHWIDETNDGKTKFRFKAKEEMAPNVYANVSLIQPHAQTANDHPLRMFGMTNINIEDKKTHLNPELNVPRVIKPNSEVDIKVSEKDGKAMNYTVAMVDEGILDLTNFQTPAPWSHFYAKEALGVNTWDIYDHVMGAQSGKLERVLGIGGGSNKGGKERSGAKRFDPMVRFIGPFKLENGATNTHTIDIPNYMGSVRTMVVAGKNQAYGHTDRTTPVKKPLMLYATMPRVISPEEKAKLPVN